MRVNRYLVMVGTGFGQLALLWGVVTGLIIDS